MRFDNTRFTYNSVTSILYDLQRTSRCCFLSSLLSSLYSKPSWLPWLVCYVVPTSLLMMFDMSCHTSDVSWESTPPDAALPGWRPRGGVVIDRERHFGASPVHIILEIIVQLPNLNCLNEPLRCKPAAKTVFLSLNGNSQPIIPEEEMWNDDNE